MKLDAEILAVGTWNRTPIDRPMLDNIVENFEKLKDIVRAPLKFGHNNKQGMTDGEPALGWVSKLWVNEKNKLMATFSDMPEIVHKAIEKKRYSNVSVELIFDVGYKKQNYGTVLTAVALLGADLPAVNTLADLQTYMSAHKELKFSSCANFTLIEETNMKTLEELQAENAALKATNVALNTQVKDSATQVVKLQTESDEVKTRLAKIEENAKSEAFTRKKTDLTAKLEILVKANKIKPADRDSMLKDYSEETAQKVEFTVDFLSKGVEGNVTNFTKEELALQQGTKKEEGEPDELLHKKTLKYAAEHGLEYNVAIFSVLDMEPELAEEYAKMGVEEDV